MSHACACVLPTGCLILHESNVESVLGACGVTGVVYVMSCDVTIEFY